MKTLEVQPSKGALFYVLLCACLGVWGYVLYQIAHGLGQPEDPFEAVPLISTGEGASVPTPRRSGPAVTYNKDFRDPFQQPPGLFASRVPRARRAAPPSSPEPPPLSLSGVVDETALLRGDDGSVYVVRVGEHAGGVQVLKVQRDYVVVRFEGRSHTLKLSP